MSLNDWIQYVLIAALLVAAWTDRSAHRAYGRVLSAMYADLKKLLEQIKESVKK